MAPRNIQQLFNLKPEELNAAAVLAGLEGYRGGKGEDVAAVMANLLSRRLQGNWGGRDLRNIAKAPGQYQAVFDYSMQQLADPAFGARVLGGQQEFNRIKNLVNDPFLVGEQFRRSKGAQSFRGVSAYEAKKPTDYMPVPGKSNFYFNPLGQQAYQQGLRLFGQATPPPPPLASVTTKPVSSPVSSVSSILSSVLGTNSDRPEQRKTLAQMFVQQALQNLLPSQPATISPWLGSLIP